MVLLLLRVLLASLVLLAELDLLDLLYVFSIIILFCVPDEKSPGSDLVELTPFRHCVGKLWTSWTSWTIWQRGTQRKPW